MSYSYKAVVFDWAYTLVDLVKEDDRKAFVRVFDFLRQKGVNLPDFDDFFKTYRELFYGMIDISRKTHREACFEHVLNALLFRYSIDIEGVATEREILTLYYKDIYSCRKIYPDVIPTLDKLKEAGVRMGILSNTTNPGFMKDYERIELGLDRYFEFSIYSSEVPYRKPHASIYDLAIQRLGLSPKDILFVGDTPQTDIAGAKTVGMPAAWINRDGKQLNNGVSPDYELKELTDLLKINTKKG